MKVSLYCNIKEATVIILPHAEQLKIKKMTLEVNWSSLWSEVEFWCFHLNEWILNLRRSDCFLENM